MSRETSPVEPIAVVGMACRLPGAADPTQLWDNLAAGVDSVAEPSERRRSVAVPQGPGLPREGGFLDSVADFDAEFFGISAREAVAMDPQQRLVLELAWEAMEEAGIVPGTLRSAPVGVFVGTLSDDFAILLSRRGPAAVSAHTMTGLQRSVIANRVSHHLGVRGPSLLVDTGQSSALVALHLACASVRAGECGLAVAGGVNIALAADTQLAAARLGVLSPRGRSRVLDRDADGFVRSEGGGIVVLKTLAAALESGDRIHCVIRGSAVNHDGAGEEMASPDPGAQAELIRAAHRSAGISAADVQYVELHGTGTPAGDAAEARALGEVFGRSPRDPLAVGSVKSNIGHLEGAAGIAGLIKAALAVRNGELPPSLHFTAPPADVPLDEWGLRVQTGRTWPRPDAPLIAGVSSFGLGGTNCHVVVAPADREPERRPETAEPWPYVLSARTPAALARIAVELRDFVAARPWLRGSDIAFTLATGRTPYPHRTVVVARDRAGLLSGLSDLDGSAPASVPPRLRGPVSEFLAGGAPDWGDVFAGSAARRVALPTYPFERTRLWPDGLTAETGEPEGVNAGLSLDEVLDVAAEVLGEPVAADVPFRDQGFDSFLGMELRDRLEEHTGAGLPVSLLYDFPTPTAIAEYLAGTIDETATGEKVEEPDDDPVVIVGIGCRYPGGVSGPDDLWRLVSGRVDAITDPPAERGWQRLSVPGVRPGGFLDGIDRFDADFFGISPREAAAMDPQQRLFLEVTWEALERAGIVPGTLRGTRTAVFAGATAQDYGAFLHEPTDGEGFRLTGSTPSVLSGRVAYVLGLGGPAITVDTACSSSLAALHLAARSLRSGESTLAVAGGVTVMPLPGMFAEFHRQDGLSADGRCRAFSAAASGTGWAEGAGAVVLERLSAARRNHHRVLAVVRGSALNSDGASNGLTAPSGTAQSRVIADALADAGLRPDEVDVVEAHGTGTRLGDPIEAGALRAAYGKGRDAARPLLIGSVKSNIGHTQAAAGLAGVIKMVLAMRHGEVPATLHADEPTPHVDWPASGLSLVTEATPWPPIDRPRRSGISSFGISGTNAHVIIEQAPAESEEASADGGPVALTLSGRTEPAVRELAAQLADELDGGGSGTVDVAYSLATTRTRFAHRAVVIGTERADLVSSLRSVALNAADPATVRGEATDGHRPVFVFGGQGAQYDGMARELLDTVPAFADSIAACERALAPHVDWSLTGVLRGEPGQPGLDRVDVVQPVLFATMVALAGLWRAYGVEPAAVIGHSQGEIAAACVAGALTLEDAALVVARRSAALKVLAGQGGMASLELAADRVAGLLENWPGRVSVAAHNGPSATTVSGDPVAIQEIVDKCTADGHRAKVIAVDYASHSVHVEQLKGTLLAELAPIRPQTPSVPLMSTTDVELVDGPGPGVAYWYRNLREPVRFDGAVARLIDVGYDAFIEVSAHPLLLPGIAARADERGRPVVLVESLTRTDPGREGLLRGLGKADAYGLPVDWAEVLPGRPVPLPTYPFQRDRFWLTRTARSGDAQALGATEVAHPLLEAMVENAGLGGLLLIGRLSVAEMPWLADHAVLDTVVLPGTACLDMTLWAGRLIGCPVVVELVLDAPVVLPPDEALRIQLAVDRPGDDGRRTITLSSRPDEPDAPWTRHATAVVEAGPDAVAEPPGEWPPPGATPIPVSGHYERLRSIGLGYGPAFRGLRAAWSAGDDLWLDLTLPEGEPDGFVTHPALLDSALHGIWLRPGESSCRLPFSWSGVRSAGSPVAPAGLRVRLAPAGPDGEVALTAWTTDGTPVLTVGQLALRPIAPDRLTGPAALFAVTWTEVATPPAGGTAEPELLGPEPPAEPPSIAVLECPAGQEPIATATRVLGAVRLWATGERYAGSRLVVLTTGGDGELSDPGHAAVWSLVRSAQNEHPGRFLLLDAESFAAGQVAAAVATGESQLRHRGQRFGTPVLRRSAPAAAPARVEPLGGTALITGGTGTLGTLIAAHLVTEYGVRRVLLLSRRGAAAPGATDAVAALTALGAEAAAVACDVADRAQLRRALDAVPAEHPLTAVVHAAGVLADGPVSTMDDESLAKVMRAKASGAIALSELTADRPGVAAFVLFSSVAGTLGTAGQANYAAANGVLDAVARERRAAGLPATSIAWGLWSRRSGMTGRLDDTAVRRLAAAGIGELDTEDGLRLFDVALRGPAPMVVAARLRGTGSPGILRALAPPRPRPAPARPVSEELGELTPAQRRGRMIALVREHTAAALGHRSADAVDGSLSFKALGCDSLIGVEIRNRLSTATGLRLPATVVFSHPTPILLAEWVLDRLDPAPVAPVPISPAPAGEGERTVRTPDQEIDHILTTADVSELFELIDTDPDFGLAGGMVSGEGHTDGR